MDVLITNVVLFAAITVIAVLGVRAAMHLRRKVRDDRPLLIGQMMGRRGITPADAAAAGYRSEIALAERICAACAAQERCRLWLAEGKASGYEEFCPNAARFPLFERGTAHRQAAVAHPASAG